MKKCPEKEVAKAAGLVHYFTGIPCKRGHVCSRRVRDGQCIECSAIMREVWRCRNREKARSLTREWRRKNPDKLRESQRKAALKSYRKNRESKLARDKERRMLNPEKYRHLAKIKHASMTEDQRLSLRETKRKWRDRNRELVRETVKRAMEKFIERNPLAPRIWSSNRRARILKNGGSHNSSDIQVIFNMQRGKCAYCRINVADGYHVDHIVSLFSGGQNDSKNLQLLCAPCNQQKWRHDPIDFARQRGMLL